MSLIFGINLCDRIYVSGDTRLSQIDGAGKVYETKDRIGKVVPISENILGAFAGSALLSKYIAQYLIKNIGSSLNIRTFREQVQELLIPTIIEYWETIDPKASVTIIFGGVNKTSRKNLDSKIIFDEIMKLASKENHGMYLKPALFNLLLKGNNQPLKYPEPLDSHLFSLQIFPPNGFIFTDTEWGQYLAYGPKGITKDNLNKKILGMLEFKGGEPGHDNASMAAVLEDVAFRSKEESIGSTFTNFVIFEGGWGVITGKVKRVNLSNMQVETLYEIIGGGQKLRSCNKDGSFDEITPINEYESFGNLHL